MDRTDSYLMNGGGSIPEAYQAPTDWRARILYVDSVYFKTKCSCYTKFVVRYIIWSIIMLMPSFSSYGGGGRGELQSSVTVVMCCRLENADYAYIVQ